MFPHFAAEQARAGAGLRKISTRRAGGNGYAAGSSGWTDTLAKDIGQAVREVCLGFPESAEVISHGSPDFLVRGRTFATYAVNHHGDGRIALWLKLPLSF